MGKLILIRHGETRKNINNALHGSNDPETLNNEGIRQIELVSKALINLSVSKIYSSKEQRTLNSAKILSKLLKVPVEEMSGLEERNWGIFTGKPWSEVEAILNPMTLDNRFNYLPPGGESWKTFETRLNNVIDIITAENQNTTIIVVTHGGAIRALLPKLLNVPREESFKYNPSNASLNIFDYYDDGFHVVTINDTSHLNSS